jgi:pimeloyl-ACP methyl ester carboxylesterase
MGFLEALHWANGTPDEVVAIVGLDPATPPFYEVMPPPRLMPSLIAFSGRTGLLRLAPSICRGAPAADHLTEAEMAAYCSIMARRTLTADMLAEIKATRANARLVAAEGAGGAYRLLDAGHYVHNEAADLIAEESRGFLERIER